MGRRGQVGGPPAVAAGEPHGRNGEIFRDLLKGLLVIALVLALKLVVERTAFGKQLELACYELLQLRLSADRVPVTIVDISDLKPQPYDIAGQTGTATPREPLRKLLAAITEQNPRAVGLDIDFSPEDDVYIRPDDPDFFQFCLDMQRQRGVPIFLGIYRTMGEPPSKWLGDAKYEDLAANILIPRDKRRMLREIKVESEQGAAAGSEGSKPSKAISVALADAYKRGLGDAPGWAQRAHESVLESLEGVELIEQVSERQLGSGLTVADFLVDFSPIDSIETIRTLDPAVLRDRSQRGRFEGKVVLLGAASLDAEGDDQFSVPGHEQQYRGVLLHACAVYTLIRAPLFEVTHKGRLYIDLLFSLAIIGTITLIRFYYRGRTTDEVATHRLQGLLTILVVLVAILVGIICVRLTRVMWDDFLLALTALAFHPSIERRMGSSWAWFRKYVPVGFRRVIFTTKEGNQR